ncbi:GNAT family N-acetyltransferase [Microvirga puerhi]|uniref:GNAT family N-acetyltransferase n=1 Tax=Microvirga puerhi TaxID=2876078 RepID=A0ABS7VNH3_9HYPH|nr:GNAT family N-acetyltransferase [Microvirga puerhi]MBZ6077076.1 GNAT family N-acetyltransferase [Microvirga puerhi]
MSVLNRFLRPPGIRIAPIGTETAARLAAIHASAFARPWSSVEFARLLGERGHLADGLFIGRSAQPSGFVLSRLIVDEAEILTLAIAPIERGKGYSGRLLQAHLENLSRSGVRHLHLEVEDGNAPALALYRRFGFREVGRRPGYYLKADGARVAALTMVLDL